MGVAEVGNIHSNSSVNIDNTLVDLSKKNECYISKIYTESGNSSVLYKKQSMVQSVNHTMSSLKGCRPGVGQVIVKLTIHVLECMLH